MSDRDERLKQEIIGRFMAGDSVDMLVAGYTEFTSVYVLIRERITKLEVFIDELARDNDLSPLTDWRRGF